MIVFIGGKPAGIEFFSDPGCFQQVHEKLIRSYAMEARRFRNTGSEPVEEDFRSFLNRIPAAPAVQYPSPGMGEDHRIRGDEIAGSALIFESEVIHLTAFAIEEEPGSGRSDDVRNQVRMERMRSRRDRMKNDDAIY